MKNTKKEVAKKPTVDVVKEPQVKKEVVKTTPTKKGWVIKDRLYELQLQIVPPVYIMKSRSLAFVDLIEFHPNSPVFRG